MALKVDISAEPWPTFTDPQVAFLERMFPARCLGLREQVEDHLRYAGKVDLVAQLREHVIGGSPASMDFSDDEEEALDDMAVGLAQEQQQQES